MNLLLVFLFCFLIGCLSDLVFWLYSISCLTFLSFSFFLINTLREVVGKTEKKRRGERSPGMESSFLFTVTTGSQCQDWCATYHTAMTKSHPLTTAHSCHDVGKQRRHGAITLNSEDTKYYSKNSKQLHLLIFFLLLFVLLWLNFTSSIILSQKLQYGL